MYAAEKARGYPVFLSAAERLTIEYRLRKQERGYHILAEYYPQYFPHFEDNAKLGELTYFISSSLFTPEFIQARSPEEILKIRGALQESRERYLTTQLMELTELVSQTEWGPGLHRKVRHYIEGKLNRDLLKYQDDTKRVMEQLFGKLAVNLSEIASAAVMGGGAGGLLGTIIPHAHSWEMLLLGAAVGAAKQFPVLTKNIIESVLELRSQRKNSIAYISGLRQLESAKA